MTNRQTWRRNLCMEKAAVVGWLGRDWQRISEEDRISIFSSQGARLFFDPLAWPFLEAFLETNKKINKPDGPMALVSFLSVLYLCNTLSPPHCTASFPLVRRGSGRGDGIWPLSLFVWLYLPHSFRLHVSGQRALEDSCFHVEPSLSSLILLSSYVFSLWHQCHRLFVYTPPLPWAATDKNEIGTTELLQVDSRFCRPRSLNQFDFYADFSNHLKWWPFLQMNK